MIGAIIGDIIGSKYEFNNTFDYNFELFDEGCNFTDDTICTIAIADAILQAKDGIPDASDFRESLLKWCRRYPNPMGGYGSGFSNWLTSKHPEPYDSFGNGAAMRVSPVSWAFENNVDAVRQAMMSAKVSHSHVEGMIGAAAVADCICDLRVFKRKSFIKTAAILYYGSDWDKNLIPRGKWAETCQECVPLAFKIVLNSDSFEDAIRNAVSYGGDSDTMGAIVGSIAQPLFGIPQGMKEKALNYLPLDMKDVVIKFIYRYGE